MTKSTQVKSPCIHVCILNDSDVCTGCFRTGQEISHWGRMSEQERRGVLDKAIQRESESANILYIEN